MIEQLSEREKEVLQAFSQGLSNPEIADMLFISTTTVRTHLNTIYSKLNIDGNNSSSKRTKLMRFALNFH